MDRIGKDRLDYSGRNRIVTIIVLAFVGCAFYLYLVLTRNQIDEYAEYTLKNQLQMASVSIDARLNDAKLSISAASGDVAAHWREGDRNFDVVALVDSIKDNYQFDVLEFVDKDGINLMSGANRFDASDREYFKEGIQGKSGLWINYTPRESKEYLLDYYSPVYYKGEIVGVLVGALGSKKSLEPLLEASYLGRESIGILYGEEGRIIAASFGAEGEMYAEDIYDSLQLTEKDRAVFDQSMKYKDGNAYQFEGDHGIGLASVGHIQAYDWGLAIIIPSATFSSVYNDFANNGMMTLCAIVVAVCCYIVFLLGNNRSRYMVKLRENDDIIRGFSKVYNSVFMLDFTEETARCLRLRDPSAAKYGIKEGETVPIREVFLKYLLASADQNGAKVLSSLDNVMYIRTLMKDRESFNLEYTLRAGGNGSIAVADLHTDEANQSQGRQGENAEQEQRNRYLLGMTELG